MTEGHGVVFARLHKSNQQLYLLRTLLLALHCRAFIFADDCITYYSWSPLIPQRTNTRLPPHTLSSNNPLLIPLSTSPSTPPLPCLTISRLPRQLLKLDIHLDNLRDPAILFVRTAVTANRPDLPASTQVVLSCRSPSRGWALCYRTRGPQAAHLDAEGRAQKVFDERRQHGQTGSEEAEREFGLGPFAHHCAAVGLVCGIVQTDGVVQADCGGCAGTSRKSSAIRPVSVVLVLELLVAYRPPSRNTALSPHFRFMLSSRRQITG
jgi:hypothetical protein